MISVKYRWSARQDLRDIKAYFDDISPATTNHVYTDIVSTIRALQSFPYSGRQVEGREERRFVTAKYGYVISYVPTDTQIEIIGVFRHQNRSS